MSVYVWVYACKCRQPQRLKEDIRFPGSGMTGGSKLLDGMLGTKLGSCAIALHVLNY